MTASPWTSVLRATAWLVLLGASRRYLEALQLPVGMASEDPVGAALATGRFLAQMLWWYLVVLTGATALSHTVRLARGDRLKALPLPGAASLLRGLTGLGMGLTSMTAGPAGAQSGPPPPTLQREPVTAEIETTPPPAPAPPPPSQDATHIVAPGQSFWTIAEAQTERRLGRPPTDPEIAPYWLRLIDANRDRLVDPTDPDLLHPGQVLTLPPATD